MGELADGLLNGRIAVAALSLIVAGFMRGFVGFGSSVLTVPIFALLYGPQTAVGFTAIPPLAWHWLYTQQVIVVGLILAPINLLATWWGARYCSAAGHRHYRVAALVVLAVIGLGTFVAALRDLGAS